MLDPKLLRTHLSAVTDQIARRGTRVDVERYNALEAERKRLQAGTEKLQADRNAISKAIGAAKAKGEDVAALREANQKARRK